MNSGRKCRQNDKNVWYYRERQKHTHHSPAPIIYTPHSVGTAMSLPIQKDWKKRTNVRFEIIRAVILKNHIFWGMTPSRVVQSYWRCGTSLMDSLHREYADNKLPQKAGNYLRNIMAFFWVVTRHHIPEERTHQLNFCKSLKRSEYLSKDATSYCWQYRSQNM